LFFAQNILKKENTNKRVFHHKNIVLQK